MRRAILREAAAWAFYLALAVAFTWPLATKLGSAVPLGTEKVSTVPLFNLWTLGWNSESLFGLGGDYWNAPIFHPTPGAFAFSEPQPLAGLLAALCRPVLGLVGAYNAVLLLALALGGWAAWRLLSDLGLSVTAALGGGTMVMTLPFVAQEIGVLQLLWTAGFTGCLYALLWLGRAPSWRRGIVLGLAFAATVGVCAYYALFLSLILLAAGWLLISSWDRSTWQALFAAAAVAGLLAGPLLIGQLMASGEMPRRSLDTVEKYSAEPSHYATAAWSPPWPTPGVEVAEHPGARAFFPGTVRLLLAVMGLVAAWRERGRRRLALFCVLAGALAFTLSLGPRLDLGPLSPYPILAAVYPGYAQLRSLFRLAVVVQWAVALLAALGLGTLARAAGRRRLPVAGVVLLAILATVEIWPAPQKLQALPPLDAEMAWLDFLENETPPEAVVAFVPFPRGTSSASYEGTVQWMYWSLRHRRAMVNGYSGFFPRSFRELKKAMATFPDQESLDRLEEHGVDYCVVLRAFATREQISALSGGRLAHVRDDGESGVDVYRLLR